MGGGGGIGGRIVVTCVEGGILKFGRPLLPWKFDQCALNLVLASDQISW